MAITTFDGISEAARAIQDFLIDRSASIPDELRDKLRALIGPTTSPVDAVVNGAELIYARRDQDLDPELLKLGAGLALVAQQYNFHGLAVDSRGSKMALAFMRDAKVKQPTGVEYPDEDKDPEVKDQFRVVVETPAPPIPEAPAPVPAATVEDTPPAEGSRRRTARRRRPA